MNKDEMKELFDELAQVCEELIDERDSWKKMALENKEGMEGQKAIIDKCIVCGEDRNKCNG